MQLLTGPCYYLGRGHRIGMDNRYTSCSALLFLDKNKTNAFGTVRANAKYLPHDAKEMYSEAKEYNSGEFQTRFSEVTNLTYCVIKSNRVVRMLSNCHDTTDETTIARFVKEHDDPDDFKEAPRGRRYVQTASLLQDYSRTMNNTDYSDGKRGGLTKFHRHSVRMSQPLLDFFTFEKAAVNAYLIYRGLNPDYKKGIRHFAEQVIEETIRPSMRGEVNCWLRRTRKRRLRDDAGSLPSRIQRRFSGKEIPEMTCLEIRNEMGPVLPDPNVDREQIIRSERKRREKAAKCMDFLPIKVAKANKSRCLECKGWTQYHCGGGRCNVSACYYRRGDHGHPKDTCIGRLHTRFWKARQKLM